MKKIIVLITFSIYLFSNTNIKTLISAAKNGNINAISKLAYIYENGLGVKKDLNKAKLLYQKASELGDKDANLALTLLELENKVEKSVSLKNTITIQGKEFILTDIDKKDISELILKAKKGDKDALFALAVMYENGYGIVKANKQKAIALYKKAYEQGSKKAKNVLQLDGFK